MDYSLLTHNKGYQFSYSDAFYTTLTGFSGTAYASRHWELGHRWIALIEFMPLLGGMAAFIERVVYAIFGARYCEVPWRKEKPLTASEAKAMMLADMDEAVRAHQKVSSVFASRSEALREPSGSPEKLKFTFEESDDIGPRPTMEDAKFVKETDAYVLAGVFDGHGGSKVSEFAAREFEKRFPVALKECESPAIAFEKVFHEIQQDIARYSGWNGMGSTAVVTYIDKSTGEVFTATIGDSEANIYRDTGWFRSVIQSIPLSAVVDWADPKERQRLEEAYGKERVDAHFKRVGGHPKAIRSHVDYGVNTSRALGDVNEKGTHEHPVVLHRPKITRTTMKKGDTLILACDGLKDYVKEEKIVEVVGSKKQIAAQLVATAIRSMPANAGDNVTVIAISA